MTLEKLKKLCDAATPGPWVWKTRIEREATPAENFPREWEVHTLMSGEMPVLMADLEADDCASLDVTPEDRAFIAEARTMLPKLLDLWQACLERERRFSQRAIDEALEALGGYP